MVLTGRAGLIALTEIEKAIADGALGVYTELGVAYVDWRSIPDARRCARCKENTDVSPQPAITRTAYVDPTDQYRMSVTTPTSPKFFRLVRHW